MDMSSLSAMVTPFPATVGVIEFPAFTSRSWPPDMLTLPAFEALSPRASVPPAFVST